MKKDMVNMGVKPALILKTVILGISVTATFIFIFAILMYVFEKAFAYAAIFATVSVSAGALASAFYTAKKIGKKGFLVGLIVGIITFVVVTLVSLIVDDGGFTQNTLFHFIIIMLSSMIGGILGVNKAANKKYI